ncbi:MAG TPA: glycosyltransferase family 2 protein [Candidatus Saccharimonadales bacterium]|nr:glycosyltransferase family 2 protein [Candidatus Saccharimonadales bacterium]
MPIAGKGSRFVKAGITTPKPLIEIKGKPMIKWATDSLPFLLNHKIIFILRKDHAEEHKLDQKLKDLYKDVQIDFVYTDGVKDGAASDVLLAEDLINTDEDIAIYNTDQYFSCDLEEQIKTRGHEVQGIIPVFYATHPKWSFAKVNDEGYVTEVKEKDPISDHATVGLYYFSHGSDYVWGAKQMIQKNIRVNNEYYVCPVYNELLARGDKVILSHSDFMWGLGTPEDVEIFNKDFKG